MNHTNRYSYINALIFTTISYNIYTNAQRIYTNITSKSPSTEQTPYTTQILKKFKPFLDQIGIRKDLQIQEAITNSSASAKGSNFGAGNAIIYMSPKFQVDPEALSFNFKHEISHIKHNDLITTYALKILSNLSILALISFCNTSPIENIFALIAVNIPNLCFKLYREGKADDFAIAKSNTDELKGGRRFFKAVQEEQFFQKNYFSNPSISSQGENLLDLTHPSLASRIQKIEKILKAKNITINESEEQEKIKKLKMSMFERYKKELIFNLKNA